VKEEPNEVFKKDRKIRRCFKSIVSALKCCDRGGYGTGIYFNEDTSVTSKVGGFLGLLAVAIIAGYAYYCLVRIF
jgi:hypothetical protein